MQLLTSAMLISAGLVIRNKVGRTKFIYGKCHRIEKTARIVLAGRYALFVGNTIFSGIDKVLRRTNDSDNRKYAKAHKQEALAFLVAKATVKTRSNRFGNISATAARAAGMTVHLLVYTRRKHDGVNNFCSCHLTVKRESQRVLLIRMFTCGTYICTAVNK